MGFGRDCIAMHFFALHFMSFLVAVEHSSEIGRQWRVSYLARTGRDPSQRAFSLLPAVLQMLVPLVTIYLDKTSIYQTFEFKPFGVHKS